MKSESNIIFYTTPNGQISVQVQYEDGSGELHIDSTTRKIRVLQKEGNRKTSRKKLGMCKNRTYCRKSRKYISDFDKEIKRIQEKQE
jgi:hypothetical protein